LKDLPTELPAGLKLGAVGERADVRDVLIYRDAEYLRAAAADTPSAEWTPGQSERRGFKPKLTVKDFPDGTVIATSSTRRKAQLLVLHPGLMVPDIRGNVATRLQKVAERPEFDATVLALAGITRLNFKITPAGRFEGKGVPEGLLATILETKAMLPCVGQGAVGIEVREDDERLATICERLNDNDTLQCVTAERAFLAAMGGGCQSPVAALAEIVGDTLSMRALSFTNGPLKRAEAKRSLKEAVALGEQLAIELLRFAQPPGLLVLLGELEGLLEVHERALAARTSSAARRPLESAASTVPPTPPVAVASPAKKRVLSTGLARFLGASKFPTVT
jgi:hydroxymethylbilane synthase